MSSYFYNLADSFLRNLSWGNPTHSWTYPDETVPLFLWVCSGFIALNFVAIICARFADLLHSTLKKG